MNARSKIIGVIVLVAVLSALAASAVTLYITGRSSAWARHDGDMGTAQEHSLDNERDGAGGHDHDDDETSDLDRDLETLLSLSCEHKIPTFTCDECRYEVGVVKVSPDLVEEGLIGIEEVGLQPLQTAIELTGEIQFDEKLVAHISPPLTGIIRHVNIDLQEEVKKGRVLLTMTSVELAGSGGDYLKAAAVLDAAAQNLERQEELLEAGGTSQKEVLEARAAYEEARIEAEAAEQKLVGLGIGPGAVKSLSAGGGGIKKGLFSLRSPIKGTVLMLHAVKGELAGPGEDVVVVGDIGTVWVWVDIYEDYLREVIEAYDAGSLSAVVEVKAYPGELFPARVDFISDLMDESTRTIRARLTIDNDGTMLRPGMFASVSLMVPTEESVIAVPIGAVLADEGREFVFVHHQDGFYARRPVSTGRRFGGLVEITSGLDAGQSIVTVGAFLLKSDVLRSKMGAGCAD